MLQEIIWTLNKCCYLILKLFDIIHVFLCCLFPTSPRSVFLSNFLPFLRSKSLLHTNEPIVKFKTLRVIRTCCEIKNSYPEMLKKTSMPQYFSEKISSNMDAMWGMFLISHIVLVFPLLTLDKEVLGTGTPLWY